MDFDLRVVGGQTTDVKSGDEIQLELWITNNQGGLYSLDWQIKYDSDAFEIKADPGVKSYAPTGMTNVTANTSTLGEISGGAFIIMEAASTVADTKVCEVTFAAKKDITTPVAFSVQQKNNGTSFADETDYHAVIGTLTGTTKQNVTVSVVSPVVIDITAPVKGATPQATIAAGTGYTGTIEWEGAPAIFAANTPYTAKVTLTAATGYKFASDATAAVAGSTSITEKTVAADGSTLSFKVTFPATLGANPLQGTVTIDNTSPKYGQTLTAQTGSLDYNSEGSGTLSYQWYRGDTAISGATSSTYTLVAADVGQTIKVQVKNSNNSGSVTSAATAAVAKADGPVAPSGLAEVSKTDTTITVTQNSAWEYSKDNGSTWQTSNTFTGLTPNTAYNQIVARVKETATHKASAACSAISVTTTKATADSTLENTLKNAVTAYNAPYDGAAHDAFTVGSLPSGWSAQYADSESGSYSTTMPKVTNVSDSKTLWVKFSNSSYSDFVTSYSVSVTAKNISGATITLNDAPTYNGSEQTITINKIEVGSTPLTTGDYDITSGNKATNVENTTLKITGKGNYTETASTTWTLKKATPTAADFTLPTDLTKNYTSSPITVAAPTLKSGKTGAGTITVKYADSDTAPTNAGSYTVTFDVAAGTNYNAATGLSIGTLTINKVAYTGTKTVSDTVRSGQTTSDKTLTLPTLPAGASYGTVTVTTDTSSLINGTPTVSGNTLTYSANSEDDSTSATLTIPVTGATNYTDYSVTVTVTARDKNAADVTLGTVPTSKTYGDANFTVTASAAHTEADGTWTWTSSDEGVLKVTGTSTTGTVQVVGQGSATITAKYESANYLGSATSGTITVNKKNVTITGLSAQNKVYDGNTTATVSGTAVVSDKVGSDDVTVTAGSADFADKNVGSGKTVTFAGYSLGGAKAGNYSLTAQPANVTANITAKDVTITDVTATTRAYVSGNKGVALTGGTVTGAVSGDTVTVDLTNATGTMTDEDAGTNKAVAVTGVALGGTDKGNYHLTAQPTGVTVTISKATYASSITANKNVKTNTALTGVEVDMSAKFGVIKGAAVKSAAENSDTDNIINNVSVSGNIVKFDVASVAAADKTATINVVISCTNFEDITAVLTVKTVDKDEAGVTISGVPTEAKTYGEADLTLTGAVTAAGTGTGNWTWEASDPTVLQITGTGNTAKVKLLKAGSATVTAKYESDTTIGQLTTANIRVNKATVTVTAKDQSIYVNGTAPDLTSPVKDTHYTVTGLASGDTLGGIITMKYQKDGVDATPDTTKTGTYDIVISGATAPAGGNYNDVVFTAGTLTISNKPSSGGGGGGSTPITVPVSDPKNQVKVTVTVSGTTATVQKIDLSKIDQAQGVTIDFTGLGKTIESAKLPTSAIKEIGATEGGTLTVKLTAGNVTFDTAALKAVADQAGSQITLTLTPVKTSALNASQKETVGDAPVFDLRLLGGSKAITNFKGGNVTVTLPHTLSKGQEPAGVVVYYLSNDGNPEACKTTYDAKNKLVTFTTTHFSLYFVGYEQPAAEWKNPFTDVAEGAWYFDSVKYVHSEGMMVGTSATKFSPDATTTRGMVVTILYRLEGEPAVSGKSTFADVVGTAWYANAVEWAAKNKIVDGYGNGKFGPEDVITREQMAVILYRYAAFKGLDMTKTADLSKFTDSGKISSWAKPALSWANAEGLVSGKGSGILDPLGSATRAEVAAMLMRYCELEK